MSPVGGHRFMDVALSESPSIARKQTVIVAMAKLDPDAVIAAMRALTDQEVAEVFNSISIFRGLLGDEAKRRLAKLLREL